jgi:hypothetical protein
MRQHGVSASINVFEPALAGDSGFSVKPSASVLIRQMPVIFSASISRPLSPASQAQKSFLNH